MTESENYYSEAEMQEVLRELERQTETIEKQTERIRKMDEEEEQANLFIRGLKREIERLNEENQMLNDRIVMMNEQDLQQKKLNEQKKQQEQQQTYLEELANEIETRKQEVEMRKKEIGTMEASLSKRKQNLENREYAFIEIERDFKERVKVEAAEMTKEHQKKCEKSLEFYIRKRKMFNIVTACIAIFTAIFSARSQKAFWNDFTAFWDKTILLVGKIIKPTNKGIWNAVEGVRKLIPYKTVDIIAGGIVGAVLYLLVPFLLFLLIKKRGKVFWAWYKRGLNVDYVIVTATLLLVQMFWGEYMIKDTLPGWNLWGTTLLFAVGYSFYMAAHIANKENK